MLCQGFENLIRYVRYIFNSHYKGKSEKENAQSRVRNKKKMEERTLQNNIEQCVPFLYHVVTIQNTEYHKAADAK